MPTLTMCSFSHVAIYFFVICKVGTSFYADCRLKSRTRHVWQGRHYVLDWSTITLVRYYLFYVSNLMTWQIRAISFEARVLGWRPWRDRTLYGPSSKRLSEKCDLQRSSTKNNRVWGQRQLWWPNYNLFTISLPKKAQQCQSCRDNQGKKPTSDW